MSEEVKDQIPETQQETAAESAPEESPAAEEKEVSTEAEEKAEKKEKKEKKFGRKKDEDRSAELETAKAAFEKEKAAMNDKYLRLMAEYDNYRRRSQKEKEALYTDVRSETALKFLPIYDDLERALRQPTEDEAYRKGVEMIMTQFTATLEKLGITPFESLGETFDPALHNAVMHVDDKEKGENEIVEVFQKGFKLGDKVIRFAMVKVAN